MIKLVCGCPRAGKTEYCKRFSNVLHLDDYGRLPGNYKRLLGNVSNGDIVIDGIFNTAESRKALLNAYKGHGKRTCIWLDTPRDVMESRWTIVKPKERHFYFEPPTYAEGWDEIDIIRDA